MHDPSPLRFGAGPQPPAGRAPLPGEHTREVLAGLLGLAGADIDGLARDGLVVCGEGPGPTRRRSE